MTTHAAERARASLRSLSVGDALGSQFFVPANRPAYEAQTLPPGPWQWTDDTEMAASIYVVLSTHGTIDQDALASSFAEHHDFDRGYGPSTGRLLRLVREGGDWRVLAKEPFDGLGSWGNGAAMRVAPLGAWFAGDPAEAARQAALSAEVTHPHPEGIAGAVAIAVAASLAPAAPRPGPFLDEILRHVPPGTVREGIAEARGLLPLGDPATAAAVLGNGRDVAAHDTVPLTLWAAARHLGAPEAAFWTTAAAGGDIDTTCAIVGGAPAAWLAETEPLPPWATTPAGTGPGTPR
ncbi:ADP-ribosylglycohydrolase family protein [Actinomadura roseirufa]|uniref:ADP-ribosylglycohydrolase family protein n=1 Tax=Actinomadura roseirufa TaxID=2094049 RepID=UPI001040F834|nr:ADP-ribosylglycohydrolase family protein [Actinomadura roseirufa]